MRYSFSWKWIHFFHSPPSMERHSFSDQGLPIYSITDFEREGAGQDSPSALSSLSPPTFERSQRKLLFQRMSGREGRMNERSRYSRELNQCFWRGEERIPHPDRFFLCGDRPMKDTWIRLQGDKEFWVLEIRVDADRSEKRSFIHPWWESVYAYRRLRVIFGKAKTETKLQCQTSTTFEIKSLLPITKRVLCSPADRNKTLSSTTHSMEDDSHTYPPDSPNQTVQRRQFGLL